MRGVILRIAVTFGDDKASDVLNSTAVYNFSQQRAWHTHFSDVKPDLELINHYSCTYEQFIERTSTTFGIATVKHENMLNISLTIRIVTDRGSWIVHSGYDMEMNTWSVSDQLISVDQIEHDEFVRRMNHILVNVISIKKMDEQLFYWADLS
jgi:hypothetical protein